MTSGMCDVTLIEFHSRGKFLGIGRRVPIGSTAAPPHPDSFFLHIPALIAQCQMRRAKVVQGQTWDQSCNQHDGGGEGRGGGNVANTRMM